MRKWAWKYLVPKFLKALWYANTERRQTKKQFKTEVKIIEVFLEEKGKAQIKNTYVPEEMNPAMLDMYPMQIVVMVKQGEQSPVDMMAARIAYRILKEGLCQVTKSTMAGEIEKYVLEVTIAKKKSIK